MFGFGAQGASFLGGWCRAEGCCWVWLSVWVVLHINYRTMLPERTVLESTAQSWDADCHESLISILNTERTVAGPTLNPKPLNPKP